MRAKQTPKPAHDMRDPHEAHTPQVSAWMGARPGFLDARLGKTILEVIPGKQNIPETTR